ncbi:MAG: GNAT family N-acetyltransferase [Alphaproteobacteria bacterium]|nr:GNAT family N-acetyltransferase [Alphaproteobacteria bacterium]
MINEIVASSHYKEFYEEGSKKETDIYDIRSKFCALRINSRIVGTGRLILADKNNPANSFISQKFPEHFYKSFSYNHIPVANIAQISRQYVHHLYRNQGASLHI